jgi:hypothetical protein
MLIDKSVIIRVPILILVNKPFYLGITFPEPEMLVVILGVPQ